MMLALLACAPAPSPAPEDTAPAEQAPVAGTFAVTVEAEWAGECDFEDPATYRDAEETWTFDPRANGVLVLFPGVWDVLSCALDGPDFTCDEGSYEAGRTQVTRLVEGVFTADDTIAGALVIELDCGGTGCDTLTDAYGRRLEFPCRSEAAFAGELE
ncbi:MAG: hypothetical protein V4850_25705 [Myxococcota bacterium]